MRQALSLVCCALAICWAGTAQAQSVAGTYVITLNGMDVTVDGEVGDWADAQFLSISQNRPFLQYLEFSPDPIDGDDDFSAFIGMKMTETDLFIGGRIVDDAPLLYPRTQENAGSLFADEHLGLYMGFYDIGSMPASPHAEVVPLIDPASGDTLANGRTYRISPDLDDTGTTLGADHQIGIHLQPYETVLDNGAFYAAEEDVIAQIYGYLGVPVQGMEIAFLLNEDGTAYTFEARIPFASLSGQLGAPLTDNPISNAIYPLYTPQDGDVLPFDMDLTDDDVPGEPSGANNFLRFGRPAEGVVGDNTSFESLWRDSFNWSGRAIVMDASKMAPGMQFGLFVDEADVAIDGDLSEFEGAQFLALARNKPFVQYLEFSPDPIDSDADFSGHIAMMMDQDDLFIGGRIVDDAPLLYPRTQENAGSLFADEHLGLYMGFYDIGSLPASPHAEVVPLIDPASGDTLANGRTYRISPDLDDTGTTLGADHQIGIHLQPYETVLDNGAFYAAEEDVIAQIYGYLGVPVQGMEIAFLLNEDGTAYTFEARIPFASLSGQLGTPLTDNPISNAIYPLYTPQDGDVLPFDMDLTDDDVPGEPSGANNFLRFGRPAEGVVGDNTSFESLWRDSFNWSGRLVVTASNETIVSVDVEDDRTPVPGDFLLSQNYPNPFNPTTSIAFNVPQAMDVTLKVYDLMGREVATLVDGQLAANRYTVDFRAENLPSGTYVYRLVAGTNVEVRKMTLVK